MEILIVTPEIAPYSRTSDLAAFAAALPKGLRGLEHHVLVVSPLYGCVDPAAHSLARRLSTLEVVLQGEPQPCTLYDGRTTGGIDLLFIGHPAFGEHAEDRDNRAARTVALILSQAAAGLASQLESRPDVIHALGFQAALALSLCRLAYPDGGPATILSLHALAEQGQFPPDELADQQPGQTVLAALGSEHHGTGGNLLAAGLRAADRVVANSRVEEETLLHSEMARPLQPGLGDRPERVISVLSGLDSAYWNPLADSHMTARYDAADTSGKDQCKGALQYELGLPARPDTPVLAVAGGSLSSSETAALLSLLRNDAQVVVAVEGDDPPAPLADAIKAHEDKLKCLTLDEPGALHRLISGADFLCLPRSASADSVLHLAGLRYGALPIAPAGGPAAEILVDCDARLHTGNGFLFGSDAAFLPALQRALAAFAQSDAFDALRKRAMRTDVSWDRAARRFEHIYRAEIARRG